MHRALTFLASAALATLALAGCGSPQHQAQAQAPAAPAPVVAAQGDEHAMTGSRIPKRTSTDRMLKTVGNREARDAMDTAPRPLDSSKQY